MILNNAFEGVTTYIFDVDGTLYSQNKMRLYMIWDLLKASIRRPKYMYMLYIIYVFRKLREKNADQSIEEICKKVKIRDADEVMACVNYWLLERPLLYIDRCKYQDVQEYINQKHKDKCKIYIYSDYPAKEKLTQMDIVYDGIFCAEDNEIQGQKPNKRAMQYILDSIPEKEKSKILYVGDRFEKDGQSAMYAEIRYCDIDDFRKRIRE